ncbi:MAG: hypothetical protein K2N73_06435 [Lachnospiraceae bacterium]|nr:hypothetical protein [Lachnospiraceae bacterium]
MDKNCSKIKEMFEESDKIVIINNAKKQDALKQINLREGAASEQKSKWQILKIQIYYMDKTILLMHMMVCIGIVLLEKWQYRNRFSMIFACVLGALSLLEISNMLFSGMTELEESCYFNVRQIVVFRMTCSGIISLAALLAAFVSAGMKSKTSVVETGLYMLVPFVFTECVCMTVMVTEIGRRSKMFSVAAGIFSMLFWGVLSTIPSLYETSTFAFWGIAFFAGTGILAIQTKRFFDALEKGDILCVN